MECPPIKEEEDIEVLQSWMEVGGLPAHPEEEAKGLFAKASSLPSLPSCLPLSIPHLLLIFYCYWLSLLLFRG